MMKLTWVGSEKALSLGKAGVNARKIPFGSRTRCISCMYLTNVAVGPSFDEALGMCSKKSNAETLAKELAAKGNSCPAETLWKPG